MSTVVIIEDSISEVNIVDETNLEALAKARINQIYSDSLSLQQQSQASATSASGSATAASGSAVSSANSADIASKASLAASASANFKGAWSSITAYTVGQSVIGSDNNFYVCLVANTNQSPLTATAYWKINVPLGAIGNITRTLTNLNLMSAKALRASYNGEFKYECATASKHIDIYGTIVTNKVFSGTATAGSLWHLEKSTATFTIGELVDYVIKVTTSGTTEYRWIVGNSATTVSFDKPISIAVTSSTTYAIARPRFTKDGMLFEGASTNLLTYNGDFSNVAWTKTNVSISTDTTLAPDGVTLAQKVTATGTANVNYMQQTYSIASDKTFACSYFVKQFDTDTIAIGMYSTGGTTVGTTGTFTFSTGVCTVPSSQVEKLAGGWFRLSVIHTTISNTAMLFRIFPTSTQLTNSETSSVYAYLPQMEESSFATSPIETAGSAVTRAIESLKIPFAGNMLNWKDASSFVTNIKLLGLAHTTNRMVLSTGSLANGYINISLPGGTDFATALSSDSAVNANTSLSLKLGFTNDGSIMKSYLSGVLQSDTGITGTGAESNTDIAIGSQNGTTYPLYGHISSLKIYNKALTPTEIALS